MTRDVIFRYQYFTGVTESQVPRLRSSPAELATFLKRNAGRSLGQYWHAVPYLITDRTTNVKEPLRWFTDGGETLGRNEAGEIRYLSPARVARLAEALADEPPDELGHTQYDVAVMDAAGVYPRRWVRDGTDNDLLGTIRELYSYVREFLLARKRDRKGVIIYLKAELAFTEDESEEVPAPPPRPAPAPAPPPADVVLVGSHGTHYARGDASAHPAIPPKLLRQVDTALTQLGYRHVGDFSMAPSTDVLRAYLSDDRTVVAIAYLSELGWGSTTCLAPLAGDALVAASDAFVMEIKKVKLFAASLSGAKPAALHASVLERRPQLAKKHGAPVALPPTLAAAVGVWASYGAKFQIGPRR